MKKYTIRDFDRDFPDDAACLEWIKNHRWPNGIRCKRCQKVTKHHRVKKRNCYECDLCGTQVYPAAKTIFHKSATSLRIWFQAIYQMASTRSGISAKQIQRETGVTYKTAWRIFHQIRELLHEDVSPMSGQVEVDETYIGGRKHGKRGRGAYNKSIVAGIAGRESRITALKIPNVKANTLLPIIKKWVLRPSTIYTDELASYNKLHPIGYRHKPIKHPEKIYVMGEVHTNTIDGFWSLLKRGISGVYHAVSHKHLQLYLDEYVFRYNHRNDDFPMFKVFLNRI